MALREFIDGVGTLWTVWSTVPSSRSSVPENLREGWLTFESGNERRRLAPIPRSWEDASVERLHLFCAAAELLDPARKSLPGMQEEATA
jgi:hypothetical protein